MDRTFMMVRFIILASFILCSLGAILWAITPVLPAVVTQISVQQDVTPPQTANPLILEPISPHEARELVIATLKRDQALLAQGPWPEWRRSLYHTMPAWLRGTVLRPGAVVGEPLLVKRLMQPDWAIRKLYPDLATLVRLEIEAQLNQPFHATLTPDEADTAFERRLRELSESYVRHFTDIYLVPLYLAQQESSPYGVVPARSYMKSEVVAQLQPPPLLSLEEARDLMGVAGTPQLLSFDWTRTPDVVAWVLGSTAVGAEGEAYGQLYRIVGDEGVHAFPLDDALPPQVEDLQDRRVLLRRMVIPIALEPQQSTAEPFIIVPLSQ